MKRNFFIGLIAILCAVLGIVAVLADKNALVFHPKGMIARSELELILINILLMLIIIFPTYLLLFFTVWKYCIKPDKNQYDPNHSYGFLGVLLMWLLPALVVAVMSIVTWNATHQLDPYKPIKSDVKPLVVQVIAMDWKWLFIYPEIGIATLNFLHIPAATPIHLNLTADRSPMNSFWIPQLSGQIYSMTGMSTQLHLITDGAGEYVGRAVEINGEGYSDMTFQVKSTPQKEFEEWIAQVKRSSTSLDKNFYEILVKPSVNKSIILFSDVEKDLYHHIVHQYMYPTAPVL